MGTVERRKREKEELKSKIVDAARELFATLGYESTTMRDIARRIEYTPGSIYLHFKDKQELVREICRLDFNELKARLAEIMVIEDPVERLCGLARAYIKFGAEHPQHYRLMFMSERKFGPVEIAAEDEVRNIPFSCLKAAIEAGRIRPQFCNLHLLAQTIWAGVHGIVTLEIVKRKEEWLEWTALEERTDAMLEALFTGILAKSPVNN